MSSAIPAQCAAVAAEVQTKTTAAFVEVINEALPIVFLIWLSFGVWLGDWSNAWTDEWALIKRGFTPAGVSYFMARVGGGAGAFCYCLTTMIGGKGTLPGSCHHADKVLAVFYCVCSVGAQATFMLRCVSVWENNPYIRAFMGSLLLVIIATFVMFIVFIDGYKTPYGLLVCNINDPPKLEVIATISTAVIDIICIALTTYKLRKKLNAGRIHQLLFRDGVIYLAIVVLVSGSLTAMLLTDLPDITRVVLSPVHLVVLSVTATRAQRALRSEGAKMATSSRSISGSMGTAPPQHRRLPSNAGQSDLPFRPSAHTEDETVYSAELRSPMRTHPYELRKMSEEATQKLYSTGGMGLPAHVRNTSVPPSPWSTPSMDPRDTPRSPRFM